jgi:hypothetical protein
MPLSSGSDKGADEAMIELPGCFVDYYNHIVMRAGMADGQVSLGEAMVSR